MCQSEDLKVKLREEKEDRKIREAALQDAVKELEQQHSDLKVISFVGASNKKGSLGTLSEN